VNIAEDPQIGDLSAGEREESSTCPFDRFASRLKTEEFTTMKPRKAHARKRLRLFYDKFNNVAPKVTDYPVDEIEIRGEAVTPSLCLPQ